jgi:hypothetical protein
MRQSVGGLENHFIGWLSVRLPGITRRLEVGSGPARERRHDGRGLAKGINFQSVVGGQF